MARKTNAEMDESQTTEQRAPIFRLAERLPGLDADAGWTPRNAIITAVYTAVGIPVAAFATLLALTIVLVASGQIPMDETPEDVAVADGGIAAADDAVAAETSTPMPTTSEQPTTEEGAIESSDMETHLDAMLGVLGYPGALVTTNAGDPDIYVFYTSKATDSTELKVEISTMTAAYIDTVESGHNPGDGVITMMDPETATAAGSFVVKRSWTDSYLAGGMSSDELMQRVYGTLEAY